MEEILNDCTNFYLDIKDGANTNIQCAIETINFASFKALVWTYNIQ